VTGIKEDGAEGVPLPMGILELASGENLKKIDVTIYILMLLQTSGRQLFIASICIGLILH
jgi:hypothetical protein